MSNPHPTNGWEPGKSGNPQGRPKKENSITKAINDYLERKKIKTEEGEINARAAFVERVIELAIADGDIAAIKLIWNYLEGMPRQNIGMDTTGEITLKLEPEAIDMINNVHGKAKDSLQ